MFKTILVHVDADDPCTANRIQLATRLAQDCHATLVGATAALPPATIEILASGGAAIAAGVMTGEPDELDARFAAVRSEFVRSTSGTSVPTEWKQAVGFPAQELGAMAARADLLVVGPAHPSSPANGYLDYAELVMRSGRPVLMVPPHLSKLDQSGAVVAWRNTRESRRALSDALPLLAISGSVTLLHVRESSDDATETASLADAQAFLAGHGIRSTIQAVDAGRMSATERIIDFATRAHASLIVAGAYGHTRVREWVFGGVTRDLLTSSPVPVLFSR